MIAIDHTTEIGGGIDKAQAYARDAAAEAAGVSSNLLDVSGSLGDKSIPYKIYGDEPVLDHDGPFQMRRCDTGELYCQDGKPVIYIGYKACAEACRYLHDNMGIPCLPSPGRKLGARSASWRWRWYARPGEDLLRDQDQNKE